MTRRALLAEGGALGRLDGSAQHISRAAERRFLSKNAADVEPLLAVESTVRLTETPAALRNHADAAPRPVGDLKNFRQQLLRGAVAIKGDSPARDGSQIHPRGQGQPQGLHQGVIRKGAQ